MRTRSLASLGYLALTLALGHGCSLQVTRPRVCTTNRACRDAFGLGSTCEAESGLCTAPQHPPRCARTYPEGLYDDLALQRSSIIVGTIYDYGAHLESQQATELAIRQANATQDLGGRRFAVIHCDSTERAGDMLTDVEAATAVTQYLSGAVEVPVIIGPRGSSRAAAAFQAMSALRMQGHPGSVLISPSATSPALTDIDARNPTNEAPGLLWRTVPPDTLQATVIADDMIRRGVRAVTVVYQRGDYGNALSRLFEMRFTGDGRTVQLEPFSSGQLGDVIARVAPSRAEEVLFVSSNIADVVDFVNGISASVDLTMQYASKRLFLTDTAYNMRLLNDTNAAARAVFSRTRGTRPASAEGTPLFNAFAVDYTTEFMSAASASGFTAHSYDAGWLALYGCAWAYFNEGGAEHTVDALGVARGLRHVSGGRAIDLRPSGWPAAQEAFRMRSDVNVAGASGALDYAAATEELTAPIEVWTVAQSGTAYSLVRDYVVDPR